MKQFSNVLKEYGDWIHSIKWLALLLPYHLYILFGGIGGLFLYQLLVEADHYFPTLWTLSHYAFFLGVWLTLAAPVKRYLPYALWAYALYVLVPFHSFSLFELIEIVLYAAFGYWFFRYEAIEGQR